MCLHCIAGYIVTHYGIELNKMIMTIPRWALCYELCENRLE